MAHRRFKGIQSPEAGTKVLWAQLLTTAPGNPMELVFSNSFTSSTRTGQGVYKIGLPDNYPPLGKGTTNKFLGFLGCSEAVFADGSVVTPDVDGVIIDSSALSADFPSDETVQLMVIVRNSTANQSGA